MIFRFLAFVAAVVLLIPYSVLAVTCDLLDSGIDLLITYADGE